jgi:hypothetical protein
MLHLLINHNFKHSLENSIGEVVNTIEGEKKLTQKNVMSYESIPFKISSDGTHKYTFEMHPDDPYSDTWISIYPDGRYEYSGPRTLPFGHPDSNSMYDSRDYKFTLNNPENELTGSQVYVLNYYGLIRKD